MRHRTGSLRGLGHLQHEFRIGTRSIFATDDDFQAVVVGVRHQFEDGVEHPGAVALQFLGEMDVRHRDGEIDHLHIELFAGIDVRLAHAAPHDQLRIQIQRGDGVDAFAFFMPHRRDADFQFRHAERIELARDVQLLLPA